MVFCQNPFEIKKRLPAKDSVAPTMIKAATDSAGKATTLITGKEVLDSSELEMPPIFDVPDTTGEVEDSGSSNIFDMPDVASPDTSMSGDSVLQDTSESIGLQDTSMVLDAVQQEPEESILDQLESVGLSQKAPINNQGLALGVIILSLLLLTSLLTANRGAIQKSWRAIGNDNYLRSLYREYSSMPWIFWLFYLHFLINAGFFTYLTLIYFGKVFLTPILLLIFCIAALSGIYFLKHLTLNIVGNTFPVAKETNLYSFVTLLVNVLLGLILSPINLVIAFGPEAALPYTIWAGAGFLVLSYFFRQLKGLFIAGRIIQSYVFHFFLYLCTAEIAPLLILGKLAFDNFGAH